MTDLLITVAFAGLFAVLALWQSWAWVLILPNLPLGMLLRRRWSRGRALVVGAGTALIVFAANTGVIGATLQAAPDFAAGVYPSYFLGLVLALCWVVHSALAMFALWTGCLIGEAVMRAQRPNGAPTPPVRRRRSGR